MEILIIGSPLLLILAVLSYKHWLGGNFEGYPQTVAGYLLFNFNMLMSFAGGIALAFLIGAFEIEDPNSVTTLFALAGAGIFVLIVGGVLSMVLRPLDGPRRKEIVYGCVLVLIAVSVARNHYENERAAEVPKRPMVLPR